MYLKQFVVTLMVSLMVSLVGCSGASSSSGEASTTPTSSGTPSAKGSEAKQSGLVSAEAFVVPQKKANLSFEISGRVSKIAVQEGDSVKKGDVLAELDSTTQQVSLNEAKVGLARAMADVEQAKAQLAQTKAPPTSEEVAQTEAQVARAEAVLAEILAGATKEDIAQAEVGVRVARAQLQQVTASAREEDLKIAGAGVLQAEADVRDKQRDYDKVRHSDNSMGAGLALQNSTLNYEKAKADYDKLVKGSTKEAIAIAQAQVAQQEAALAKVKAGSTAERIAQAQADVAAAQAGLAKLLAGATKEQIAISEAGVKISEVGVESAKAQVASAENNLAKCKLVAPFDGVVGLVTFEEGEMSGQNEISVGDFSHWQVETDDLTEIDVVQVQAGQTVKINVDALPGEKLEGKVLRINPRSETKAGDVTYTALIDVTGGKTELLRWGMTTFVDISTGK